MPLEQFWPRSASAPTTTLMQNRPGTRFRTSTITIGRSTNGRLTRSTRRGELPTAGAARRPECGIPNVRLDLLPAINGDRWMQDFDQPAYVSMPGPHGTPITISLLLRSATNNRNVDNPPAGHLLRNGSRILFSQLRGPGVGVVQAYDPARIAALTFASPTTSTR